MSVFRFADPWFLALAGPLVVFLWWWRLGARQETAVFSSFTGLSAAPISWAQRAATLLTPARFVALTCLVVGLARPQQGEEEYRVRTEGIAVVACLDRSGSMEAMDFQDGGRRVDRMHVAKTTLRDFVAGDDDDLRGRRDDLVGLVVFGGFAESRVPLTLDHDLLVDLLDDVQVPQPIVDSRGRVVDEEFANLERATAIGDALALGVSRLAETDAKSRVLILLSDGENTAGVVEPRAAAEAAKAQGVKVYSIGIGTTGTAPFPTVDPFGRQRLERRKVVLDEALLRDIAKTTDGAYFNARTTEALRGVYEQIDALERTELESQLFTQYRELYLWFVLPGLALLLLERLARATRLGALP